VLVIALADVVDQRTAIVVATVPALVAVVVARQVIALRDNADLLDRLDANLTELKAAWDREREANAAREALEVELRYAHKLEAVGRLAAGVAHEINTPIQFISDNTRFLGDAFDQVGQVLGAYRDALAGDPRTWPDRKAELAAAEEAADLEFLLQEAPVAARQTLDGAEHAGRIVQAMKAFGHPGSGLQEPADLNEALRTTITFAQRQLEPAEVRTELGELPEVTCYLSDLNQVFLNLLINAADAVAERGEPGSIAVTTRADGEDVEIVVADTGTGIPDEIRDRIFDPFFTTKPVGQGSGQGLTLVHAIVTDRHHGTIAVDSKVGQGTTITVRLPVAGVSDLAGEPVERPTQPVRHPMM
jgi:signal transduction histidine kinase